jgi:hypothetical protein
VTDPRHPAESCPAAQAGLDAPLPSDATVHAYFAFGMKICSSLALPELQPGQNGPADLTIRLQPAAPPALPEGRQVALAHYGDVRTLTWLAVGTFRIVGHDVVEVTPAPGVPASLLAFPLLGPVMALLLHVRGLLVLHAGAVEVGGGAAVFLGDKLAGKSTTSAAFVRSGHRLVTDDLLALDFAGGTPLIQPGFPQLKLDPVGAGDMVAGQAQALPEVMPGLGKRQHRLHGAFSLAPLPPRRLYVLERGGTAGVERLPDQEALKALIRYSYLARFPRDVVTPQDLARHMGQCAGLATFAGVSHLCVPDGLDRLAEVVDVVKEDCR